MRPCAAKNHLPIAPAFAKATAGKDCPLVRRPRVAEALAEAQTLLPR
jgi:hypothetical protein